MDADAIHLVSDALKKRLAAALGENGQEAAVYVGPLDDDYAKDAAAALFLYRVALNADLRSSEHVVAPRGDDGAPVVYENALPLDLHYLLTVGAAKGSENSELEALGLLGRAMRALADAPFLVGVPVRNETVRISMDPVTSEEMSRIWALFPTVNYRTSVAYLVSPVWIDPAVATTAGPPVRHEPHRVGHRGR
jgi:hypothetical protein